MWFFILLCFVSCHNRLVFTCVLCFLLLTISFTLFFGVFFFSSRRRHTSCALVTGFRRVLFRSTSQRATGARSRPMFTRLEDKSEPGRSPCSIFVLQHGQNRSFGPTGPVWRGGRCYVGRSGFARHDGRSWFSGATS